MIAAVLVCGPKLAAASGGDLAHLAERDVEAVLVGLTDTHADSVDTRWPWIALRTLCPCSARIPLRTTQRAKSAACSDRSLTLAEVTVPRSS